MTFTRNGGVYSPAVYPTATPRRTSIELLSMALLALGALLFSALR